MGTNGRPMGSRYHGIVTMGSWEGMDRGIYHHVGTAMGSPDTMGPWEGMDRGITIRWGLMEVPWDPLLPWDHGKGWGPTNHSTALSDHRNDLNSMS